MGTRLTGFERVTRAKLQVKDRTVMPPDRTVISYHILVNCVETLVEGSWGDYLRDRESGIVVKKHAPLNETENPENALLIQDVHGVIPDRVFILDPTVPLQ